MTVRRPLALLGVLVVAAIGACSQDDGGDAAASFCDTVRRFEAASGQPGAVRSNDSTMSSAEVEARVDTARGDLRAQVAEAERLLDDLESTAPSEVSADLEVFAGARRRLFARIKENDYDPAVAFDLDPSTTVDVAAAESRINAFTRAECGTELVPQEEPPPPEPSAPPAPTAPREPPAPPAPPAPPEPPDLPEAPDPPEPQD